MDKKYELTCAVLSGVGSYLRTTRGANAFGSGAKFRNASAHVVEITDSNGDVYYITVEKH